MKVLHERPPEFIMTGCMSQFRVNVDKTCWTYGDTLFVPGGWHVPDNLMAHEETHSVQQAEYLAEMKCKKCGYEDIEDGFVARLADDSLQCPGCKIERRESFTLIDGKDGWWKQYLTDPTFRFEQELQAYGMQYAFFCKHVGDRNRRYLFLREIAQGLSGPLYQVAISRSEAEKAIKETAAALK